MTVWLATKTKAAIDAAIAADNGTTFKAWQGRVLPHIADAYAPDDGTPRSHLGASVIGAVCSRAVAYGWRWVLNRPPRGRKDEPKVEAASRLTRLWNRGHLEEGRIIAMLLTAGIQVYQQDAEGKQYRIADFGGHFGGACDGVLMGVPDLPVGTPCLNECKTHSEKSFVDLVDLGVRLAKPQHYVQMQKYMGKLGLLYALYVGVNKNDDSVHYEIVQYDGAVDAQFRELARSIIFDDRLPPRLPNASPGYFQCKYMCDTVDVCFSTVKPDRNCRTCQHGFAMPDGTWLCALHNVTLDKAAQMAGCQSYKLSTIFKT
jgi:hypothetical protein